jgi:hypothetical protein
MKVTVKELEVHMELGNRGIEFQVKDNDGVHLGDLRLGKGKVEWCPGRTHSGNGIKLSWRKFIELLEGAE